MAGEEVARGAEAIITRTNDAIDKYRPEKSYRHPVLDQALRKQRTRKEAKILKELEKLGVPAPKLISVDDKTGHISMTEIRGEKLRDVLDKHLSLCEQVGEHVTMLHNNNIIHGDLTTSNMLVQEGGVVALIDFGLTYHSTRIEDRAVDLHLFKQALESKHHNIAAKAWELFLNGYRPERREAVLERLVVVEQRGRNKT